MNNGFFWRGGHLVPDETWAGRGLAWELGSRAYTYLITENRKELGHANERDLEPGYANAR